MLQYNSPERFKPHFPCSRRRRGKAGVCDATLREPAIICASSASLCRLRHCWTSLCRRTISLPGRFFLFKKSRLWFESRSAQSCGSVTAHCRLAKHSAAHSSVHETARHVHDHSKLRHKVGRDSGGQHGAPAIERTRARPDGGATMLNAQLVHPGLRPPSISPAIA